MRRAAYSSTILFLLGTPALVVGAHDVLAGADVPTQLTGVLYGAAGGVMLGSAVGLLVKEWRQTWAPHMALIAGVTAFFLSASLFFLQLRYRDGPRAFLLGVWAVCAVAAIAAIWLRPAPQQIVTQALSRAGTGDATPTIGFWPRSVARLSSLLVPAGLVFSIFQFWYVSVPTGRQFTYALTLSQTLTDQGKEAHDSSIHSFLIDFHIKNPTSREIRIIRTDYELYGSREVGQPGSTPQFAEQLQKDRKAGTAVSARFLTYGPSDLLEVGTATGPPGVIAPSAEEHTRLAVGLPESEVKNYSHLALITTLLVANNRFHTTDDGPFRENQVPCLNGYDQCTVTAWKAAPPGWLWLITRGRQLLETFQNFDLGSGGPLAKGFVNTSEFCIEEDLGQLEHLDRVSCENPKSDTQDLMSLGFVQATIDLPLLKSGP